MRLLNIVIEGVLMLLICSLALAQQQRKESVIFMHTTNGNSNITFNITSVSNYI